MEREAEGLASTGALFSVTSRAEAQSILPPSRPFQKSLLCNFASLSSSLSDALAEARSSLSHHELRHAREAALAEEADALRQAAREQVGQR